MYRSLSIGRRLSPTDGGSVSHLDIAGAAHTHLLSYHASSKSIKAGARMQNVDGEVRNTLIKPENGRNYIFMFQEHDRPECRMHLRVHVNKCSATQPEPPRLRYLRVIIHTYSRHERHHLIRSNRARTIPRNQPNLSLYDIFPFRYWSRRYFCSPRACAVCLASLRRAQQPGRATNTTLHLELHSIVHSPSGSVHSRIQISNLQVYCLNFFRFFSYLVMVMF
ncbi:hypothetical protein PFISCL1PPCAC_17841 [Pristionchus fissidentatus]|uniref:Uncharacterized protein n=1 Tax=Pristionchus fissidentatus TaxID=1538716 RepID=A0AAV5W7D3_9BILA|nr:hypothetical protein PFISCL1PPCAC_17841 [Pristionchus fissidentatus]